MDSSKPIVFFDGVCSLCNGFVDFLIRHDPKGRHQFASLQGKTAAQLLTESERQTLSTLILLQGGTKYIKSAAVFQIMKNLGGRWGWLALMSQLPRGLTDFFYDRVAVNRYRIAGQKETCRIPTPAERHLLLD